MKNSALNPIPKNKSIDNDWNDIDTLIDLELETDLDVPMETQEKTSKGPFCDQPPNTFIVLDSDEDEDDNINYDITNIHSDKRPIQEDSLFLSSMDDDSFLASHSPKRFRSISPTTDNSGIQIISSPSPPPIRHFNQCSSKNTSWISPLSSTKYDMDMLFSPSPTTLLFDHEIHTGTNTISPSPPLLSAYTSNDDQFVSSPLNKPLTSRFSADIDTLIISDNDSVDSLPSTSELLSQLGQGKTTNKRHIHTENSTTFSNLKGKQVDTSYKPTTASSSNLYLSSGQLWEWDDGFDSTSLRDTSNNPSYDTSQATKKEARTAQRMAEQEAKKQARAMALLQKEQEKAEALRLKEQAKQLQQVNRLRKDRSELVKEMTVVVLDMAFMQSDHGKLLQTVLEEKGAKIITKPTLSTTFTLTWQMDCRAEWDDIEKQFIPYANGETKCKEEQSALIFMTAEGFINIIHQDRVETWIDSIQQTAPTKQLFLMIEGLETFYKKKMNLMRRQFAYTVLGNMATSNSQDDDDSSEANRRTRKRKQKDNTTTLMEHGPRRDQIEDALTYLQVIKDVMLVQTLNEEDTVDWLVCLTTDLARGNYNTINTAGLFKGQGGAIKSGIDADDVWSKMLQEIQNCTPAVAKSVTQCYPNVMSLYQRYTQTRPDDRGLLLADLEVERSVLSSRDRTINKVMSRKIHRIFMTDDPTDVIA